jgi:16S rRNA (uracil1498-N3)-methyltransferase
MREQRIYVDSPLNCEARLTLSLATSHYISKVLRMRSGQHLLLFNGHGGCYRAEILSISKREVEVYLQEFRDENRESILHITLAQAVSRTQHMDYTLQKAVELGVSKIVPVITEFGNVRIDSAGAEKKLGHWQKIIISACEQCSMPR